MNINSLPPSLLAKIADPVGGRVTLVLGAGCSKEPPTNLPVSWELSEDTHRRLVKDNVLVDGDCADAADLSVLADVVFDKKGSQVQMVERFPLNDLRMATPNQGYLLAAAMMRERAVASILTLNFDVALTVALAMMGASEVSVIAGPQDANRLGVANVVYVHRNVEETNFDLWILRTKQLETEWKKEWEEVIAARVLAAPMLVFAGLGSPSALLTKTVKRIREAKLNVEVIQVDVVPFEKSQYASELGLPKDSYVQAGWCDLMAALAERLVEEHRAVLEKKCTEMQTRESLPKEDVPGLMHEARQSWPDHPRSTTSKLAAARGKLFTSH